jgi:hypothetical protein
MRTRRGSWGACRGMRRWGHGDKVTKLHGYMVTWGWSHVTRVTHVTGDSLAPRFDGRNARQIRGQFIGWKSLDMQTNQAEDRDAEVHGAVRAIHEHGDRDRFALTTADDVEGFLDTAALGDDVLDNQAFLLWRNFESASKHQFSLFLFDKDEAEAELTGDFLTDDEPAHRGGNDGGGAEAVDLRGERCAEPFDHRHLLKRQGALKKLAAVQAAAQDKMAFKQCAGLAKQVQGFSVRHGSG